MPREWKQSHITPIHKRSPVDNPSNYRPISVICVVAKILKKVMSIQLLSYLESHQLLHSHQGAYHHGRSNNILLVAVDTIVHHLRR